MARYIYADKLIDEMCMDEPSERSFTTAIECIEAMPTEDVRPVVRGKWIRITQGRIGEIYRCSRCGRTIEEQGSESLISVRYPFCHCGADMREVEE